LMDGARHVIKCTFYRRFWRKITSYNVARVFHRSLLNGAGEVAAADCWLLLAVPVPGSHTGMRPAAGTLPRPDAETAESPGAAAAAKAKAAIGRAGEAGEGDGEGRAGAQAEEASTSGRGGDRMASWYFDAVTGGGISAMRAAAEAAARKCDALGAEVADAETRLAGHPR